MTEGLFLLIVSALLLWAATKMSSFVSRRKFNRRNSNGVEEFESYDDMTKKSRYEFLLTFLSILFYFVGIFGILVGSFTMCHQ